MVKLPTLYDTSCTDQFAEGCGIGNREDCEVHLVANVIDAGQLTSEMEPKTTRARIGHQRCPAKSGPAGHYSGKTTIATTTRNYPGY